MNKTFYKRVPQRKTFFSKDMDIRSFAYGEDVEREFILWEKDFINRSGNGMRYLISCEGSVLGRIPRFISGKDATACDELPTLTVDGVKFSATRDGILTVDGKRSEAHLGTELKAWAVMSVTRDGAIKNFLFVIGKPHGATHMALSMYEIDRYMNVSFAKKSIEISQTYDLNSYINCLGKHIFVVHNSKLDYIYYNINKDELETVAIGRDGKNEEYPACNFVDKSVIADMAGRVFWLSQGNVYGTKIGYPRDIMRIDTPEREIVIGARCDRESLYIFRKDKNSGRISAYRYGDTQDGSYGGRAIEPSSLPIELNFSK